MKETFLTFPLRCRDGKRGEGKGGDGEGGRKRVEEKVVKAWDVISV